ncbi:MAG: hypothetical protein UY72_C0007G0016 [Candidatus Uhrbacteria bacterium GW2011_GWD2_52_7]|uniref:Uncharacterized protein n=1 Tax=Candidatus Uhrbacteria bacterium GW2011_GWD2_52_7 TaxID=1618989 RepID=A0A0G2ADX1_9BACT|nr:MAG: hypothetical protein UY72_C0007G0016 [Candidatus Uhrbacteria bacterium GW2011_GWD2_52_7]
MLSSWLPAAGEVQAKRARAKRQVRFAREEHGDADAGTNGRATAERHGSVLVAVVLCLDVLEAHARVRLGLFNCGLVHLVGLVAEDAAGDCARARRREGDDRRDRPRLLLGHLHLLRLGGDRLRVRREDDAPAVREGAGRVAVRHDRRGLVDLERLLREERAQVGDRQITIRRRVEHVREREQKPRGGVLVGACGADRETALVRPVVCRDALGEHAGRECDDRRHVGGIVEERHRLAARLKHRLLEARDVEERPLEGNRRVGPSSPNSAPNPGAATNSIPVFHTPLFGAKSIGRSPSISACVGLVIRMTRSPMWRLTSAACSASASRAKPGRMISSYFAFGTRGSESQSRMTASVALSAGLLSSA